MSYTKTNWHDGDTITAVKMNKIENGIESSLSDALVTLGKALCGDSFETKPGLTDAETILEIAKNYEGGSGESESGGGGKIVVDVTDEDNPVVTPIVPGLTMEELAKYQVVYTALLRDYIVRPDTITASKESASAITKTRNPEAGESVRIIYETSNAVNTYIVTPIVISPYEATIEFEKGVIRFGDRSDIFIAAADDGEVTITVVKNQPDEKGVEVVAPLVSVIPDAYSNRFNMFYFEGPQPTSITYNIVTGKITL